uniref:Ubiquitin carboxyl-terminal hydrolase MINDY n=1 Tax=Xenopus tropicalis TaxID=8364 RepID=A0A1B8Y9X7_XENTR
MEICYVQEVASSLVREFLSRKGLKKTSLTLEEELPRAPRSISTRNELRAALHLDRLYKENKLTEKPLKTLLEIMTKYFLEHSGKTKALNMRGEQNPAPPKGLATNLQQRHAGDLMMAVCDVSDDETGESSAVSDTSKTEIYRSQNDLQFNKSNHLKGPDRKQKQTEAGVTSTGVCSEGELMPPRVNIREHQERESWEMALGAKSSRSETQRPRSSRMDSLKKRGPRRSAAANTPNPIKGEVLSEITGGMGEPSTIAPANTALKLGKEFAAKLLSTSENLRNVSLCSTNAVPKPNAFAAAETAADGKGATEASPYASNEHRRRSGFSNMDLNSASLAKKTLPFHRERNDKEDLKLDDVEDCLVTEEIRNIPTALPGNLKQIEGKPIDLAQAVEIKKILFGSSFCCFSDEWKIQSFTFNNNQPLRYGFIQKKYSTVAPLYSTVAPLYSTVAPLYSTVAPQYSTVAPQYSTVAPLYSTVAPLYSTVAPLYSTVAPLYSTVAPLYSTVAPLYSTVAPQYSTVAPQYSTVAPQYSTVAPQYSTVAPQYSTVAPLYSTVVPQYSTVVPQYSTVVPLYSTVAPLYSNVAPLYSTVSPLYSTVSTPVTATVAPPVQHPLHPRYNKHSAGCWGFRIHRVSDRTICLFKGGPCGVLAAVQGCVLKNLLFGKDADLRVLQPSDSQRTSCLCKAIADILWRAGDNKEAVVALSCGRPQFSPAGRYKADGILESRAAPPSPNCATKFKLILYKIRKYEDLMGFVQQHISQFELGPFGCTLLTLSVVLSRSVELVQKDFDVSTNCLIGAHSYCTQELVNLILSGRAVSNVFNDVVELDSGNGNITLLRGVAHRTDIGFLSLFEHYNVCQVPIHGQISAADSAPSDRFASLSARVWAPPLGLPDQSWPYTLRSTCLVGSYLKTPRFPIWVICSESHFSVLFCVRRELMSDWKMERRFDLYYYDGLANQQDEIRLTVDTAATYIEEQENDLTPPLEHCIRTKWKGAVIDWNGTEPIL